MWFSFQGCPSSLLAETYLPPASARIQPPPPPVPLHSSNYSNPPDSKPMQVDGRNCSPQKTCENPQCFHVGPRYSKSHPNSEAKPEKSSTLQFAHLRAGQNSGNPGLCLDHRSAKPSPWFPLRLSCFFSGKPSNGPRSNRYYTSQIKGPPGTKLWMDEILYFETRGNHCWLVFTGGIESFQGFVGGAKWISQPSTVWRGHPFPLFLIYPPHPPCPPSARCHSPPKSHQHTCSTARSISPSRKRHTRETSSKRKAHLLNLQIRKQISV